MKKLLELRLRLVGSLRRTARAWGFSHHENHSQNRSWLPQKGLERLGRGGKAPKHPTHIPRLLVTPFGQNERRR